MKKKKRLSLDPKNKSWDRYYIINYLEPGKHWSDYQEEIKMQEAVEAQLKRDNKLKSRYLDSINADSKITVAEAPVVKIEAPKVKSTVTAKNIPSPEGFNVNAPVFVPKQKTTQLAAAPVVDKSIFEVTPEQNKKVTVQTKSDSAQNSEVDTDNEEDWIEKPDYTNHCFKCLFSDTFFSTAEECLDHMTKKYKFNLNQIAKDGNLGFYDIAKIINYTRLQVLNGKKFKEISEEIGKKLWNDLKFMFPTFEDDQLLYSFQAKCEDINEDFKDDSMADIERGLDQPQKNWLRASR